MSKSAGYAVNPDERTDPWRSGMHVGEAARELLMVTQRYSRPHFTLFMGTPLDAYPGELESEVVERWDFERKLYQIAERAKTPKPDWALSREHLQAYEDRLVLLEVIKELREGRK